MRRDATATVVEYEVLDGLAIFEGDIVLGRVDPDGTIDTQALALRFGGLRADGVVPYAFSRSLWSVHRDHEPIVHVVAQAKAYWELTTPVRFVPVTEANRSGFGGDSKNPRPVRDAGDHFDSKRRTRV